MSQYNVGLLYLSGQGIKQNAGEAAKYFDLAAAQGQPDAQYNNALLYLHSKDEKDKVKAFKLLQNLATNGFVAAQSTFGLMYLHGDTVPKNPKTAATWITLAANGGSLEAQYNLGVMYHNGQGVDKDEKKSVSFLQKAADAGYPDAEFNIGLMHEKGMDVPKDENAAKVWFKKAAAQGDKEAKQKLATLEHIH